MLKQVQDRSQTELSNFNSERKSDAKMKLGFVSDYDKTMFRYLGNKGKNHYEEDDNEETELDISKLLNNHYHYNKNEMFRKEKEATHIFDKDIQTKKIKEQRRKLKLEHKQFMLRESGRRSFIKNIADENLELARVRVQQLQKDKINDFERDRDYLQNGSKLLDLNQKRFKEKVNMLDMRSNGVV